MTRTAHPRRVIVHLWDLPYEMNLEVCRRALLQRQIEGDFDSVAGLAALVGMSRSTVSRFLCGRGTSPVGARAILEGLKLSFDEVFTLVPAQ